MTMAEYLTKSIDHITVIVRFGHPFSQKCLQIAAIFIKKMRVTVIEFGKGLTKFMKTVTLVKKFIC